MDEEASIREAKVSYTTKELLQRIDDRFERFEAIVVGMATRQDVDKIDRRVNTLEKEAHEVRAVAVALTSSSKERFTRNEKVAGVTFLVISTLINILSLGPDVLPL